MMSQYHDHIPHVTAATPTISLLRLSAGQRLVGAALLSMSVWVMVLLTIR
jgi:hypothetical protein